MTDNPNPQPTPQQAAEPQPATEKWTEIEHLPEWDEEFYHVYTAKKHGKWVMLKTLRPEFKDDPECREMMGREFEHLIFRQTFWYFRHIDIRTFTQLINSIIN